MKKLSKSTRKHIRKEKARIRLEFLSRKDQKEATIKFFTTISTYGTKQSSLKT